MLLKTNLTFLSIFWNQFNYLILLILIKTGYFMSEYKIINNNIVTASNLLQVIVIIKY